MKKTLIFLICIAIAEMAFAQGNRTLSFGDTSVTGGKLATKDFARNLVGPPPFVDKIPIINLTEYSYTITPDKLTKFNVGGDLDQVQYAVKVNGDNYNAYSKRTGNVVYFNFGTPVTGTLYVSSGIKGANAPPVDLSGLLKKTVADTLYQKKGNYLTTLPDLSQFITGSYTGFDNKYLKTISGTFAQLRAISGAVFGMIYQPTDHSAGPAFFYDPSDNTTPDNNGTVIVCADGKRLKRYYTGDANLLWFGNSLEDGSVDNSGTISAAIASVHNIYVPNGKTIYLSSPILINNLNNWSLKCSEGATITGYSLEKNLMRIIGCNQFNILGGNWTHTSIPTSNSQIGTNGASSIYIQNSTNYIIEKTHIFYSAEMGICQSSCANGQAINNTVNSCFRDGIYADYSVNMLYNGNHIFDVKDDALSMHDYGVASQRTFIAGLGYSQAGYSIITNNRVENAYEGFSSLHCTNLRVEGNIISNTVNSGINISNNPAIATGGTSVFSHIKIVNNTLENTNKSTLIMGVTYPNQGQNNGARGSVFIGTQVQDQFGFNSIFTPTTIRGFDVIVAENQVNQSGANAYTFSSVDRLSFTDNQSLNCNTENVVAQGYPIGYINEFRNCGDVVIGGGNTVVDTRATKLHIIGAYFYNTTGQDNRWLIRGFTFSAKQYDGTVHPDSVAVVAAQIQSDNNQLDNAKPDFIKNQKIKLSQFVNDPGFIMAANLPIVGGLYTTTIDPGAVTSIYFLHNLTGITSNSVPIIDAHDGLSSTVLSYPHYVTCDATSITITFPGNPTMPGGNPVFNVHILKKP